MADYTDILVDQPCDGVLQITLNRPEVRNALRTHLLAEICEALEAVKADDSIKCVLITGGPKVFAAGADLKEIGALNAVGALLDKRPEYWAQIRKFPKPIVAAVNGYALGGGHELAMHADIIVAGRGAQFGQPEINLGIIPGAGGTQRLFHAVGKSLAMKMVLTGEPIGAEEAKQAGLVAEIVEPELTIERALTLAKKIAAKPTVAARLGKEAVLKAMEMPLEEGLNLERRLFCLLFATEDKEEGVSAFFEKRKPNYQGR